MWCNLKNDIFCYLSQWRPNTLTKLSVEVQPVPLKYKCWNPSWSKCILRIIFVHVALAPTLFVFPCQRSQFSPNEPEKQVAKAPNWFQTKQDFPNGSFLKENLEWWISPVTSHKDKWTLESRDCYGVHCFSFSWQGKLPTTRSSLGLEGMSDGRTPAQQLISKHLPTSSTFP